MFSYYLKMIIFIYGEYFKNLLLLKPSSKVKLKFYVPIALNNI